MRLRSGWEHWTRSRRRRRKRRWTDIKSNSPHLTGGEQTASVIINRATQSIIFMCDRLIELVAVMARIVVTCKLKHGLPLMPLHSSVRLHPCINLVHFHRCGWSKSWRPLMPLHSSVRLHPCINLVHFHRCGWSKSWRFSSISHKLNREQRFWLLLARFSLVLEKATGT